MPCLDHLAADVGPDMPEKDLNGGWKACWDSEAGSVLLQYGNGEATWLPPAELMSSVRARSLSKAVKRKETISSECSITVSHAIF